MGAIGLNPIRLDRIGLDPIRINAIKLGVPGASGTDRPYIDPEVLASLKAVCICYGKSNDDPDRAVVKNLVDPDNPFVISNAAYTEGSGYADKGSPYYGAFVTDGIDDLITSTKTVQEMLGGSNEITVVSMIHQIGLIQVYGLALTNYIRNNGGYLRSAVNSVGKTGIYGYTANNLNQSIKDRVKVINTILGDKKRLYGFYIRFLCIRRFIIPRSKLCSRWYNSRRRFSTRLVLDNHRQQGADYRPNQPSNRLLQLG